MATSWERTVRRIEGKIESKEDKVMGRNDVKSKGHGEYSSVETRLRIDSPLTSSDNDDSGSVAATATVALAAITRRSTIIH